MRVARLESILSGWSFSRRGLVEGIDSLVSASSESSRFLLAVRLLRRESAVAM